MKNLKSFLVVLLALVFLSYQSSSQSYSEKTDMELIQMLEKELNKQEILVNQQKEHLQNLNEQLNQQLELNKILNQQMNDLQNQLNLADESYKNSKKDTLKDKIIISSGCLLGGFIAGSIIVNLH